MPAAFDSAPQTASSPVAWANAMEAVLSAASIIPTNDHVATVRFLLDRVPDHGLTQEWRNLVGCVRAWIKRIDARPVPAFNDFTELAAALDARPRLPFGWQREHAAVTGDRDLDDGQFYDGETGL